MTQQWNWLRRPLLPALPPPRLTADIYETPGGEAYMIEIPIPGLTPEEIVIDVTSDNLTVSTSKSPARWMRWRVSGSNAISHRRRHAQLGPAHQRRSDNRAVCARIVTLSDGTELTRAALFPGWPASICFSGR